MRWFVYHIRSATFHRRTNLAVALGATVATASLTGALIVGDSMRGSLLDIAVGRLGRVDDALVAQRFVRDALSGEIAASLKTQGTGATMETAPVILLRGGITHSDWKTRVEGVNLLGVDERFWRLDTFPRSGGISGLTGRFIILNEPLAAELHARVGDAVLLHTARPSAISTETLFGRRDEATAALRLEVAAILPAGGLAAFDLSPRQRTPGNAFVPLDILQRTLEQQGFVNAMVAGRAPIDEQPSPGPTRQGRDSLQAAMQSNLKLADLGLKIREDTTRHYFAVEIDAVLIDPGMEEACIEAARAVGLEASPTLAHLANTIAIESPGTPSAPNDVPTSHVIPYSTVVAIDPESPTMAGLTATVSPSGAALSPGEILLNQWAADDLSARPGDRIAITYYVSGHQGEIETRSALFVLRGVVPLAGPAADPGFIPEYHGVTDAVSLADWNPPFPINLKLVRGKDEAYWKEHRTTPKAFITLADGQRLWATEGDRFGKVTSVRLTTSGDGTEAASDLHADADAYRRELLRHLDAAELGLRFQPIRDQVTEAAGGGTDFGMLFVSFSFFLIIAAAMLVALLFRLGVERRAFEIGLLLASGFTPRNVFRIILIDGVLIALVGGLVGVAGAVGYAWLMLAGLRTWWSGAVQTPLLRLHVVPVTVVIGFLAGLAVAAFSIAWSVRGLTRRSPRSLLDGIVGDSGLAKSEGRGRAATVTAAIAFAIAIALAGWAFKADASTQVEMFFSSGSAMLVGCLAILAMRLCVPSRAVIHTPGVKAMTRIGARNAQRNVGRSMLTAGLIASAVFVIVSLEAFRLDADATSGDRYSGTGGFTLYAESVVPLAYDLSSPDGRKAMGVGESGSGTLSERVRFFPFRLRPGDESSCLNLYRPRQPRILGAPSSMIERGGFRFARSVAESAEEKANPWTLLNRTLNDGAIPAIGDESAIMWQLHLGLGKDLVIQDDRGDDVRLRFVGLLKGSVLQGEVVIADAPFRRLFPSVSGQAFFLIETPQSKAAEIERSLERDLSNYAFDASGTDLRLASYFTVQNTYISTFQTLGGLGLLLGTGGLAAVLLRNIWERRRELALMRTVGFSHAALALMVLVENAALLIAGVIAGLISAGVAIAPTVLRNASTIPWASLSLTIGAVLVIGMAAGVAAVVPTLRAPLIPALRNE